LPDHLDSTLHPITIAAINGAFESVIREMAATLRRTAMSPVLTIGNDFSNGILDAQTRMVVQGHDQPVHLAALMFASKEVVAYFGDEIFPGDVIYHNDPRTGGSHLQDMTLYKPVFVEDELVFWAVNRSHMNETGGSVPGGYNPVAEEIWAEGLRISPVKLYEQGHQRRDVIDLLATNFRTRREFRGDLSAQLAACSIAEDRLRRLVARYGAATVNQCIEYLLSRSEQLMRAEIRTMPDGVYHGIAVVEDDGRGSGDSTIECSVEIRGDELSLGLTAPPQVHSYINSYAANSFSAVYLGIVTYLSAGLPLNEGLYRPVSVDLGAPGSIINAVEPAACGLSTNSPLESIVDAVRAAFAQALPGRAGAAWAHACGNSISGVDAQTGDTYAHYLLITGWGGGGAFVGRDGEPCLGSIGAAGAAMTGDIELLEHAVPIRIDQYEFLPDSGGPGEWRGGLSCTLAFTILDHEAVLTQFGDGMRYPASGALDAGSCYDTERVFRKTIVRLANHLEEPLSLHCVRRLLPGDRVVVHLAGGGGVGLACKRDPSSVQLDVRNGVVSPERAEAEYGVILDPDGEIEEKMTAALRASALLGDPTPAPTWRAPIVDDAFHP
jgi:N-methylhydantoinase B